MKKNRTKRAAAVAAALAIFATGDARAQSQQRCAAAASVISDPWATPAQIAVAVEVARNFGCMSPPRQRSPSASCVVAGRSYDQDNLVASLSNPAMTPEQKQFSLLILKKCIGQ